MSRPGDSLSRGLSRLLRTHSNVLNSFVKKTEIEPISSLESPADTQTLPRSPDPLKRSVSSIQAQASSANSHADVTPSGGASLSFVDSAVSASPSVAAPGLLDSGSDSRALPDSGFTASEVPSTKNGDLVLKNDAARRSSTQDSLNDSHQTSADQEQKQDGEPKPDPNPEPEPEPEPKPKSEPATEPLPQPPPEREFQRGHDQAAPLAHDSEFAPPAELLHLTVARSDEVTPAVYSTDAGTQSDAASSENGVDQPKDVALDAKTVPDAIEATARDPQEPAQSFSAVAVESDQNMPMQVRKSKSTNKSRHSTSSKPHLEVDKAKQAKRSNRDKEAEATVTEMDTEKEMVVAPPHRRSKRESRSVPHSPTATSNYSAERNPGSLTHRSGLMVQHNPADESSPWLQSSESDDEYEHPHVGINSATSLDEKKKLAQFDSLSNKKSKSKRPSKKSSGESRSPHTERKQKGESRSPHTERKQKGESRSPHTERKQPPKLEATKGVALPPAESVLQDVKKLERRRSSFTRNDSFVLKNAVKRTPVDSPEANESSDTSADGNGKGRELSSASSSVESE